MLKSRSILLLICVIAIAALSASALRPAQDKGILAAKAVFTISDENQPLNRVTKTTFRMSPSAATQCLFVPTSEPPHAGYHCHVFANDAALEPLRSGHGKYPLGSVIVKQKYWSRYARKTELFTIMRKMDESYDPENGNWEYSIVDDSGEKLLSRGREKLCISCHTLYQKTDFVSRVYLEK